MNRSIDYVRSTRDWLLGASEEPPLAAHLVTPRTLYGHHGIYVGNGRVIHYAGLAHGWRRGPVEEVSLERFAQGRDIRVREDPPRFDRREVVERARSRLGERSYRILTNNCEHFCAWALRGESRSAQVERLCERIDRYVQSFRLLRSVVIAAGREPLRHTPGSTLGHSGVRDAKDAWPRSPPLLRGCSDHRRCGLVGSPWLISFRQEQSDECSYTTRE